MMQQPAAPRLTIAIPTLNRAYCLAKAIDSALGQVSADVEVIVSNNGSRDETHELLDKYRDPRLRIFHRESTIPACQHGNFLIGLARGEFFLGLSDDDFIEPDFAARVIEAFDRSPSLSFVYTGCWIHFADVRVPAKIGPAVESGTDFVAGFLGGNRDPCWCACVTRTDDLRRIGPIPNGMLFGDMFYWTRLAFRGDVGCVAAPVSNYIVLGSGRDNLSTKASVIEWATEVRMLVEHMAADYWQATNDPEAAARLRRDLEDFVARSTADQFIWNAIRGVPRLGLLRAVAPALTFLLPGRGQAGLWLRIFGAIFGRRSVLRRTVLMAAAKKARDVLADNLTVQQSAPGVLSQRLRDE
ncbi:glycosyltransferase [Accumulibacter sp.]|uniref:glycosyltransferase family 2 protein n=1 Tax=Accumulibacter sp. TaxID=2053492 RepID=UPI0028C47D03|nr:glycosyltransferase [Accumulibacter sp.]